MEAEPEIAMPTWLDNDFVETLLRENEDDVTIVVQEINVRSAVGKGENYGSQMHRVAVKLTKSGIPENRYLIVKSLPESEMMMKLITDSGIFDRETRMHLKTLPAMYDLARLHSPNNVITQVSCKAYKTSRPSTIVMDDLQQLGYKMAVRQNGLDLVHSKLAIGALARLHALSRGLAAADPDFEEEYKEHLYIEESRETTKAFTDRIINSLADQIATWEGFERFAEKIKAIDWVDIMIEAFKIKDELSVLNHGDAWVNNMMFIYEEGQVKDIKLLDFQMSRYVSLGMDLQYFLNSSPSEDVRFNHWDDLLGEYHKVLVQTLKAIDYVTKPLPSLEAIKKEVNDKTFFGVFTCCCVLPIVLADPSDAPDLSKMMKEEDTAESGELDKTYASMRYRKLMEKLLLRFEKIGFF